MKRAAFSLVELSIVLVILGLLVGGVLSGQALIKAAELRKFVKQQESYQGAILQFREKYFAIPGDFADATRFWGRRSASASCITNSGTAVNGTGSCDGNGNGSVVTSTSFNVESTITWEHLSLAGMVAEKFAYAAGMNEGTGLGAAYPGHLALDAAMYFNCYSAGDDCPTGDIWYNTGHYFKIGRPIAGTVGLGDGVLQAQDAYGIDTKIDDGKPGSGRMLSSRMWIGTGSPCNAVAQADLCVSGNPVSHSGAGVDYNLSAPGGQCSTCNTYIKIF